jgi:methylisocitrate lyase
MTASSGSASRCARLKAAILAPELLVMPSAYDALSARLIQEAGFAAVQCSGLGIAASRYGVPDVSIVSMREMVEATRIIARSVDLPVMGDGDTGYGNAVNTWHTVREFEEAGAAGLNLEDQILPKRCGRMDGKEIVAVGEMVGKLEAAADARRDRDFVINARTDALSLFGMEEVIRRGNAYLRAGATMFFVEGLRTREDVRKLVGSLDGPLAMNLIEDGAEDGLQGITFEELQDLGVARVSLSVSTLLGAMHGVHKVLRSVDARRGTRFDPELHVTFADLHHMAGTDAALALAARFGRS